MSLRGLKALKGGVSSASDVGFVTHAGHGEGLEFARGLADATASGASLADEYGGKVAKGAQKIGLHKVAKGAEGVAKASSKISKVAPALWAADMVKQGIDVAVDPEANKRETAELADQPAYKRAWHGLNDPIKTIAGAGQLIGDLASAHADLREANKSEQELKARLASKKKDPLAK